MARVNVEGTRRVLDAAAAVGITKVVRVSSATVYGAWANNPVPLTEDAALRPNPGFSPAVQAAEVERLLAEWRGDHPGVVVTTLRTAPVLGPGAERLPSRLLLGDRRCACGAPRRRCRRSTSTTWSTRSRSSCSTTTPARSTSRPTAGSTTPRRGRCCRASPLPALPGELVERVLARTWAAGRRRPAGRRAVPRAPVGDRQRPAASARLGAASLQRGGDRRRPREPRAAAVACPRRGSLGGAAAGRGCSRARAARRRLLRRRRGARRATRPTRR